MTIYRNFYKQKAKKKKTHLIHVLFNYIQSKLLQINADHTNQNYIDLGLRWSDFVHNWTEKYHFSR